MIPDPARAKGFTEIRHRFAVVRSYLAASQSWIDKTGDWVVHLLAAIAAVQLAVLLLPEQAAVRRIPLDTTDPASLADHRHALIVLGLVAIGIATVAVLAGRVMVSATGRFVTRTPVESASGEDERLTVDWTGLLRSPVLVAAWTVAAVTVVWVGVEVADANLQIAHHPGLLRRWPQADTILTSLAAGAACVIAPALELFSALERRTQPTRTADSGGE